MPLPSTRRHALAALAAALLSGSHIVPVSAQAWTSGGSAGGIEAGFAVKGEFRTMRLSCRGGALALSFPGLARGLFPGNDYTMVVSVDGTAYILPSRTVEAADGAALVGTMPATAARPLIEALKAGRAAEISGPTGRTALPLKGSGKALAALETGCGL